MTASTRSRRPEAAAVPDGARPRLVLATTCAGMFLVLLDVTIVNVALPRIARDLGGGVAGLQWVVDGYAVTIASLLLAGGTLGDRWGHRRVLLGGFGLFGVASLGCALAPTVAVLVGARVVQGAGAALLLPSTMAIVADTFPERQAQARALGTWAAVSSLALPVGPVLGGLLVGSAGWRLIFWINIPLALAAVAASMMLIPAGRPAARARFDHLGLVCFVVALAAAVFAVITAGHGGPPVRWAVAAGVAVAATVVGVRHESRVPHPILPVDLLRRRDFASPNLVALTMNLVFNGLLFVATLYLQDLRGEEPVAAGALVLPLAVPLVVLAPVSGRLTARYGPRRPVSVGTAVAVIGALILLAVRRHGSLGPLLVGFGVLGCGAGLVTASVVAAVVRATPADRSGLATGVSNTARQVGTASGVALFGAIAGAPTSSDRFVTGFHVAAAVGAALWVIAWLLAVTGVDATPADRPPDYARNRA